MYSTETKIRVRYAETDRMGYVYYGNFAEYFEVGRVESLRELGLSYKDMEDNGIIMPVLEMNVKYFKPAYYDDLLIIRTTVAEFPTTRIKFICETYNEANELLNKGEIVLVFVNSTTKKPCSPPENFIEKIQPFF
ncbi:MAG: acyl-CoA thioesterase [Bacteroidetes bacterium]|nr:acyl-CoA thioesterase [Bacteroidota bacterium]HET6243954.1 thioesterase family protein [Bacteroidia bacterium]